MPPDLTPDEVLTRVLVSQIAFIERLANATGDIDIIEELAALMAEAPEPVVYDEEGAA